MGLDGFSIGNLGVNIGVTSAQMANQVEQIAKKESEIKIKSLNESAEGDEVKRKKEQEQQQNSEFDDGFSSNEDSEDQSLIEDDSKIKIFEKADPKEFSIRLNKHSGLVELVNNKDARILETIEPDNLMHLIEKLDNASGILVNRKI